MKYILKKPIEGIDWEVGEVRELDIIGDFDSEADYMSPLDLHNLLLNGTIEKVEENKRWRAEEGEYYWYIGDSRETCAVFDTNGTTENGFVFDSVNYEAGNYFRTREQAQAVANQIKELLIKSHANLTK